MRRLDHANTVTETAKKTAPWLVWAVAAGMFAIGRANAVAVLRPPPPSPDDGDALHLYVGDQESYDSNLYRIAPGVVPATFSPKASRADTINTATLGGEGQWLLGRQVFDLDAHVDENRFARNDALNYAAGDGKFTWNWEVGNALSGQAGAEYNHSLADYAETLYLGRDLLDTKRYFGDLRYQVGPHWSVYGDVTDADFSHSAAAVKFNDARFKSSDGGIEYASGVGQTFALEYRYTDGYYPQDFFIDGVFVNRDYREDSARFLVNYGISDKTSINGYAGYVKRFYTEAQLGHVAGDIWRVSVDWRPTEKTDLVAASWHELHAYATSEADYFISQGLSVSPVWDFSEKLTFSVVASFENQDYTAFSIGTRTDKIIGEQINVLYKPRSNLYLNLFLRNEQRKSTVPQLRYNDEVARVSATFRFW